jgi:hypothetical protein
MTPVDVIRVDWPSSRNGGDTKISDIHIADVNDELAKDVHAKEMQKRSMSDPIRVYYEPLKTPNLADMRGFTPGSFSVRTTPTNPMVLIANKPPAFSETPLSYPRMRGIKKHLEEVIYRGPTDEPGYPYVHVVFTPDVIQVLNESLIDHRDTVVLARLTANPEKYSALTIYRQSDRTRSDIYVVEGNSEEWLAEVPNSLAIILSKM